MHVISKETPDSKLAIGCGNLLENKTLAEEVVSTLSYKPEISRIYSSS